MIEELKSRFSNFRDKEFRPGQEQAIQASRESSRRVVAVCGPTGSGKSLIGMGAGVPYGRMSYLCLSKQLQHQLVRDFPEALHMMGRGNFGCNQDPYNRTADLCVHTKLTPCRLKSQCLYEVHKRRVLDHPLQICNYCYFLAESNYVGQFTGYPFIVCDEADTLEGLLTGFIELRLSRARLDTLNLSPPDYRTSTAKNGLASWRKWAEKEGKEKITRRMRELEPCLHALRPDREFTREDCEAVKEYRSLEGLRDRLDTFPQRVDDSWIFHEQHSKGRVQGWVFQPVWLTPALSHQYFFRHGDRFLLMSATFPPVPVLATILGLQPGDIDYLEIPSTFPAANRPVLLNPIADMAMRSFEDELPKLLRAIESLLDRHPHEKGMIHTTSWKLNAAVMGLKHPRLVSHNSHDKDRVLEAFRRSQDKVFVSPSSIPGGGSPR